MRIFITIPFLFLTLFSFSQTYEDLLSRLDTSDIEYVFDVNGNPGIALSKSEPLPDILCRKKVDGINKTTYFRLHGENDIFFLKAEKDMDSLMYEAALDKYLTLLDSFPNDTYLMTRVGYAHEKQGDLETAKEWYQKSLDGNTIAFDTRKRMARVLVQEKTTRQQALDHIIRASIMNRNDQGIEDVLRQVAKANKSKYTGWEFKPKTFMSINDKGDKVNIDISDELWRSYALSQAAYLFEPGYKEEQMARTEELLTITPYRESLLMLYETIRKKKVKDPMLKALKKTMKLGMLEEFMMYEIFLPMDAYTLFSLDDTQKSNIYRYVKEVKLGLKK